MPPFFLVYSLQIQEYTVQFNGTMRNVCYQRVSAKQASTDDCKIVSRPLLPLNLVRRSAKFDVCDPVVELNWSKVDQNSNLTRLIKTSTSPPA